MINLSYLMAVLIYKRYCSPGQLSLAIPPWVGTMSTSESWGVNRHTVQCTTPSSVVWQCKLMSD